MTAPLEGTTTNTPLDEAVARLRDARRALAETQAALDARKATFVAGAKALLDAKTEQQATVDAAETTARALGLAAFKETGDKRPAVGVEVKERTETEVLYDALAGFRWAKEKGICINPETLNVKAFEALVLTMTEADRPAFVRIETHVIPQVQLAKDLDAAFAKAGAAA